MRDAKTAPRIARRKVGGMCQDCGWDHKPTRVIKFWVNGMRYRVHRVNKHREER